VKAVTKQVVTEVVTGGYTSDFPILVTTVTDLSGRVNQERKVVVSTAVTEIGFRRLRGYNASAQNNSAAAAATTTRAGAA
jgi:hypothetical protein